MTLSKSVTYVIAISATVLTGFAFASGAWNPPAGSPPANNVAEPINVSATEQVKAGKMRVEDIYITKINKWVSELTFTAPEVPVEPEVPACAFEQESCYTPVAGQCAPGYYLSGTNSCCSIDTCNTPASNKWIINKLKINFQESSPNGSWATKQVDSFVTKYPISRVRLAGDSNDGGYCYAYWGSGHVATTRQAGKTGIYNVNNTNYTGAPTYVSPTVRCTGGGQNRNCTESCPGGGTLVGTQSGSKCRMGYSYCPTHPATFTNDGTAKICAAYSGAGGMATIDEAVTIPAGATVTLEGRHVRGPDTDVINCGLDIQYAE